MGLLNLTSIYNLKLKFIEIETIKLNTIIVKYEKRLEINNRMIGELINSEYPNRDYIIKGIRLRSSPLEKKLIEYRKQLEYLKYLRIIRKQVFTKFIRILNKNISKEILKGGKYKFDYDLGTISVLVTSHKTYTIVDWIKSFKILESIVEKENPELLKEYKEGKLKRFEFIQKSARYIHPTFNKPRWLVYILNDTNWWFYFRKRYRLNNNVRFYKFTPQNYIGNNIVINKLHFPNIESVIQNSNIGLLNKLTILKTKFQSQKIYYDDLSNNK